MREVLLRVTCDDCETVRVSEPDMTWEEFKESLDWKMGSDLDLCDECKGL